MRNNIALEQIYLIHLYYQFPIDIYTLFAIVKVAWKQRKYRIVAAVMK